MTLSATQMQILTAAAEVPDGIAVAPPGLPAAAETPSSAAYSKPDY